MLHKILLCCLLVLVSTCVGQVVIEVDVPRYYTPLYEGVYLAGSFNNWNTKNSNYRMTQKTKDNEFTSTYTITLDLPVGEHQFKFTRGSWLMEEKTSSGGFVPNHVIRVNNANELMQVKYTVSKWADIKLGYHTASGNVFMLDTQFDYPQFNTTKRIWIYLPSDYYLKSSISKTYSVLYMHDAQNLFDSVYSFVGQEWGVDESLEKLSSQQWPTSIVVGMENTDLRTNELTPFPNPVRGGGQADKYLDFLVNKVKPFIDANFRTRQDRMSTAIIGSSFGGLNSLYASLKYPHVFSKVGVFSPAFYFTSEMFTFVSNVTHSHKDTKFYFVCGAKEVSTMVGDMLTMVDLMKEQGYQNIRSIVKADGEHREWFWNREFTDAYTYLLY